MKSKKIESLIAYVTSQYLKRGIEIDRVKIITNSIFFVAKSKVVYAVKITGI